ncbi:MULTISPECIES: hypothetical protein [unclassified Bradyrhizobium]|uniref:hypothetical protein n=1 Tax=unclassified Bradyrhizobium TaxID=2631580 RepID=UPI0028EC9A75|nr:MULTISPECIES: hypothetical protein [unclassified Bradyrhizobium]
MPDDTRDFFFAEDLDKPNQLEFTRQIRRTRPRIADAFLTSSLSRDGGVQQFRLSRRPGRAPARLGALAERLEAAILTKAFKGGLVPQAPERANGEKQVC